jgi:hypothetical protein
MAKEHVIIAQAAMSAAIETSLASASCSDKYVSHKTNMTAKVI